MPLFENKYQAAAKAELEYHARDIDRKDKTAQTKEADLVRADMDGAISFAKSMGFIDIQQAEAYRQRIRASVQNERYMRNEAQERVDDIENPMGACGALL